MAEPEDRTDERAPAALADNEHAGSEGRTGDALIGRNEYLVLGSAVALLFLELFLVALNRAKTFNSSYDIAYFKQATFYVADGDMPFSTIRALYVLADHASYILFPIGWITAVLPRLETLLGVQALALAIGLVPLFFLCRRVGNLSLPLTTGVLTAYALYPALHNVNLYDFHPEVIAIPSFLAAVYCGLRDRWVWFGVFLALALSCREDMAIPAAMIGLVFVLSGKRRAGILAAVAAATLLIINIGFVMPSFAEGQFVQGNRLPKYGDGMFDALLGMIANPDEVAIDLTRATRIDTIVGLLGPLLFLSLLRPKWLLPALPLQTLYLLSNVETAHTLQGQYTVAAMPFIFIAAVMALSGRRWPARETMILLVVASIFSAAQYAADVRMLMRNNEMRFVTDPTYHAINEAARLVQPGDSVVGSIRVWQRLAERDDLYNFPMPFQGYEPPEDPMAIEARRADVDWIIVDTVDRWQWSPEWTNDLERITVENGFQLAFNRDGVLAYRR